MASQVKTKEDVLSSLGSFTERLLIPRKCVCSIVELLRSMNEVEFTEIEVDTSISKALHVFQSKDKYLRVLSYAFIRSVTHLSSGAFIAINALINEITSKKDPALRAEALKLLLQITPTQMLEDASKYVQQALIEGQANTLGLITPVCLFLPTESIETWFSSVNWIASVEKSGAFGNAIALMSRVRPHDNRILLKIVCSTYLKGYSAIRALQFLVPFVGTERVAYEKFESFLKMEGSDEAVFIEAVRQIPKIKDVETSRFVKTSLAGLRSLLSSQRAAARFAALRTIETLAAAGHKDKLSPLRGEIEDMLNKGKGVALLAMSVLLRIGTEKVAGRISKQLPKLMSEMGDEQKLSVIDSVEKLCIKFGSKAWVPVLEKALSDRGTCEYKIRVVRAISATLRHSQGEEFAAELETILCRYIEDSHYPIVTMEILGVLAGKSDEQHISAVMNRLLLDNDAVKMAAVCVLGSIGKGDAVTNAIFSVPTKKVGVGEEEGPAKPSSYGAEFNIDELGDMKEEVLQQLGDAADAFPVEKKEISHVEQVFGSTELKRTQRLTLTRKGAEYGIGVVKHVFSDFIVLEYIVESKIDMTLEKGQLEVRNGKTKEVILSEDLFLPGRGVDSVFVRLSHGGVENAAGTVISTLFTYVVNDNRDYETGDIKMEPFMVTGADFVAPCSADDVEAPDFEGEHCLTKEFRLGIRKQQALAVIKEILEIGVQEESDEGLTLCGRAVLTGDGIFVRARGADAKSGSSSKLTVSIVCPDARLRDVLMDGLF